MTYIIAGFFWFGLSSTSHASIEKKTANFVLCKNQNSVRTIRVVPDDKGCTTTYSKAGVDAVVEENRSLAFCKDRLKTLQESLEASSWACRSVDKAEVTYSAEAAATLKR